MSRLIHILRVAFVLLASAGAARALNDAPLVFENVEAMRRVGGVSLPPHQAAQVLGYYAANDGGGGSFYWLPSAGATLPRSNLGTVFAPLSVPESGRWVRLVNTHQINVLWFGVRPVAFDDPLFDKISAQVANSNLARIHDALDSLPRIPGGASPTDAAHVANLYFPAQPFVRRGEGADGWIRNSQATYYFISDSLRVTKNCTISGDGMDRSVIAFAPGAAPDMRREKFVVDFEKWGITGTPPSQGESFECHLRDIGVVGGAGNGGSSGVRMDGAQMSSLSNLAVSDVGLRGVVASAYYIHNLSIHRVGRGPGLEVTQNGSDFGFCSASHIFVGFVNVTGTSKGFMAGPHKDTGEKGIGDDDYWPAVQLNRCEHFTCADLRIERAPIALKIGHCGAVHLQHLSASAPQGTKGLSAVKLQNPRDGGFIGLVSINGLDVNGYDYAVWDHARSAANDTPTNQRYAVLSSFHRETNDLFSGRLRLQGQGPETPLQVFAHPSSKSAAWLCELFGSPLTDTPKPAFRVRNDGLIEAWGGTVPVSTQPLRIVQTPMLHAKLPAMEGFASSEQIVSLAGNAISRSAVVTAGFMRRDGANGLPAGVIADASVVDSAHVAIRFTNLHKDPQPGGTDLSFKLIIHDGTEGAVAQ
jgi:hypothetical protein